MSTRRFWWDEFGSFRPKDAWKHYPHPGDVTMHYRLQMGLTRRILEQGLGISASMACRLEKYGTGLDSVDRCRKLVSLLHIPAFLFGLDSLPHSSEGYSVWWIKEGYYPFDAGDDDYPLIGQVIKHYRRLKFRQSLRSVPDPDEEQWTQNGLGAALKVSEFTVRKMENFHQGLDTISRRQALAFFLNIPPILLGLDSLAHEVPAEIVPVTTHQLAKSRIITLEKEVLGKFWKTQESFWVEHFTHDGQGVVGKALREMKHLRDIVPLTTGEQQLKVIELQSLGYQFISAVALESRDYTTVFRYEDQAIADAREIKHNALIASALLRRGMAHYGNSDLAAAIRDIDEAIKCSKDAPAQVKGTVLQNAGMIHAHAIQDNADITDALHLLDKAENIARTGNFKEDSYFLKFNVGMYHIRRAIALIAIGRLTEELRKEKLREALDQLELAEKATSSEMTRRHALINLFRAQAHCRLGEYHFASREALQALSVFKKIHSYINIGYVTELYYELRASSYGNAPLVLRLGWELGELGELHQGF